MNKTKVFLLAVAVATMVFTFSCSSNDGDDGGGGGSGNQFNSSIKYESFTDSRDNKTYKKVTIGSQVWMAENLNYTGTSNNTGICYENEANCTKYGRLYTWNEANTACPADWHLPDRVEWITLVNEVADVFDAGKKLKSKAWNGTDVYGFSALPGGYYYYFGSYICDNTGCETGHKWYYEDAGSKGYWWTATAKNTDEAYTREMDGGDDVKEFQGLKQQYHESRLSVRCVRDESAIATPTPTKTTFADNRDGKTYNKVTIGTQTWMAENLNYDVPNVTTDVCYNNSADSCAKYGRLYDWATAKSACPANWHLPSDAEWMLLRSAVGGRSISATKLKSSTGWNSSAYAKVGTDDYGFSALPGGGGNSYGDFYSVGEQGYWWSATEYDRLNAWVWWMLDALENVNSQQIGKDAKYSVRCVQN